MIKKSRVVPKSALTKPFGTLVFTFYISPLKHPGQHF